MCRHYIKVTCQDKRSGSKVKGLISKIDKRVAMTTTCMPAGSTCRHQTSSLHSLLVKDNATDKQLVSSYTSYEYRIAYTRSIQYEIQQHL